MDRENLYKRAIRAEEKLCYWVDKCKAKDKKIQELQAEIVRIRNHYQELSEFEIDWAKYKGQMKLI